MKAEFTDTNNDSVEWTNERGEVWNTKLSGDGQIPNQLKEWVAKGNTIQPFQGPPLADLITIAKSEVISFANSITNSILSQYPEAEQRLWPKYEAEARAFDLINIQGNSLSDFPTINGMLDAKLGKASTNKIALTRISKAVPDIIANADNWLNIAQYVSGLRARTIGKLDTATTQVEIDIIIGGAKTEAETLATQFGIKL